jgi:hypothetical protein
MKRRNANDKKPTAIDARKLLDLLASKHVGDVFVPECKTGPSYCGGMFRMDAWAMTKSWAKMCCTGYEIKVDRGDFLRDDKWQAYLPYCNAFYFVTSPGIVQTDEVPPDAGLMVCSTNATNLFTKKKAPFRQGAIADDVFRYVLMWRAEITREHHSGDMDAAWWRDFVEGRANDQEIGWRASKKIREVLTKQVDEVHCKQIELERRLEKYAEVEKVLKKLDIHPDYIHTESVESKLKRLNEFIPPGLKRLVRTTIQDLKNLESAIEVEQAEPTP